MTHSIYSNWRDFRLAAVWRSSMPFLILISRILHKHTRSQPINHVALGLVGCTVQWDYDQAGGQARYNRRLRVLCSVRLSSRYDISAPFYRYATVRTACLATSNPWLDRWSSPDIFLMLISNLVSLKYPIHSYLSWCFGVELVPK
jgi:hypothetical protein